MKITSTILALICSLGFVVSAQAADRKLGNVIAVERTLENIYQGCIDQVKPEDSPMALYSCSFDPKTNTADFAAGRTNLLNMNKDGCMVEGVLQNSVVHIMFQGRSAKANFADAKACLRKAIDASPNKDSFKYTIFTIE